MESCCDSSSATVTIATPVVTTQRRQRCSPDRTGSRECDDRKRNTVAVHTGYTEQLPDSLDGKCNTTSLVSKNQKVLLVFSALAGGAVLCWRRLLLFTVLILFAGGSSSLRLPTYEFLQ